LKQIWGTVVNEQCKSGWCVQFTRQRVREAALAARATFSGSKTRPSMVTLDVACCVLPYRPVCIIFTTTVFHQSLFIFSFTLFSFLSLKFTLAYQKFQIILSFYYCLRFYYYFFDCYISFMGYFVKFISFLINFTLH
jgi:hypothetical protein